VDGLISTSTCRSQPQILPLLKVLGFGFFKSKYILFRKLYHHTRHTTMI